MSIQPAIDSDKAREAFALADGLEPNTALAIGYPGEASVIADEYVQRDLALRERKPLSEIILEGSVA